VNFYVGLHIPFHASRFDRCMVSVNRLRSRVGDFQVDHWIMDSGAFTEICTHGRFRFPPEEYARQIRRWSRCGTLVAAVGQDWMCEPFALEATGASVSDHQRWTVERFQQLMACDPGSYVMPVLQGWTPDDYVRHVRLYGELLPAGGWVGVGSVCKRNTDVGAVEVVLRAILEERPDLRLHGFGLKVTTLREASVRDLLHSADSMAWSYSARKKGRDGNCWTEARRFKDYMETMPVQTSLFHVERAA
jgi:hypothetical protein